MRARICPLGKLHCLHSKKKSFQLKNGWVQTVFWGWANTEPTIPVTYHLHDLCLNSRPMIKFKMPIKKEAIVGIYRSAKSQSTNISVVIETSVVWKVSSLMGLSFDVLTIVLRSLICQIFADCDKKIFRINKQQTDTVTTENPHFNSKVESIGY